MSADALLSRLDGVRKSGSGRWMARCPAHSDRHPSLCIRELDGRRVLVYCHAGCSSEAVLAAAGFEDWSVLFPERPLDPSQPAKPERRPFIPAQVFGVARHEVAVVAIIASDMHRSRTISAADFARLNVAAERLEKIAEHAYGR